MDPAFWSPLSVVLAVALPSSLQLCPNSPLHPSYHDYDIIDIFSKGCKDRVGKNYFGPWHNVDFDISGEGVGWDHKPILKVCALFDRLERCGSRIQPGDDGDW